VYFADVVVVGLRYKSQVWQGKVMVMVMVVFGN
jgi:hypothetical protein